MGHATRLARAWLDSRYRRTSAAGVFHAHQPIYGLGRAENDDDPEGRLARLYALLRLLDGVRFETFLDVGGGDGFVAHLVRDLLGARVVSGDLSVEAGRRAWELFELDVAAFDAARLPFRDGTFDVVLCSEMIEHVEFPIEALLELARVARGLVVVTSEEFHPDPAEVERRRAERRDLPHAERNAFGPADLRAVLGEGLEWRRQYLRPRAELADPAAWLRASASESGPEEDRVGGIALLWKDPRCRGTRRRSDEGLLRGLLGSFRAPVPLEPRVRSALAPELALRLACPRCRGALAVRGPALACAACGLALPVEGGVPDLYARELPDPTPAELERRLGSLGLDATRVREVLELRARLAVPDGSRQRRWDFARAADRAAWVVGEELVPRAADGSFRWRSTGATPMLVSPLLVLGPTESLEVELRIHNPAFPVDAADARLFWMGPGDLSFGEDRKLVFRPRNDGVVHRYAVELARHPRWPRGGGPVWLRLDPVNGPGEVDLLGLRFL